MATGLNLKKDALSLIFSILIGLFASILVLIYTLNLTAALLILVFAVAAAIFQISFSNGWLFVLLLVMLFPSMAISSDGAVLLIDLLLVLIALVGLIGLALEKVRLASNRMLAPLFLFFLLALLLSISGEILNRPVSKEIMLLGVQALLIFVILLTFQYYFQTLKRLRKFFIFIMSAGLIHSIFGLIMFLGGWQTFSGMGIANIKITHFLFQDVTYAINGFFGLGLEARLAGNALVPFLMVSIPVTVGLLLTRPKPQNAREKQGNFQSPHISDLPKHANQLHARINLLSDVVRIARKPVSYENLRHKIRGGLSNPRSFLISALIIQVLAFSLTFSYIGILFLGIGFFAMGIILRDRRIITVVIIALVFFSVVIPNFRTAGTSETKAIFNQWQDGFGRLEQSWLLGHGWQALTKTRGVISSTSPNSFLYVWNSLGISGVILLLFMLANYFRDVYRSYIKSEGEKRVWLVVIVAIFINLTLQGILMNTLFFGPAALIFWLLYGVALNLRKRQIMFGLIDSKIFK